MRQTGNEVTACERTRERWRERAVGERDTGEEGERVERQSERRAVDARRGKSKAEVGGMLSRIVQVPETLLPLSEFL